MLSSIFSGRDIEYLTSSVMKKFSDGYEVIANLDRKRKRRGKSYFRKSVIKIVVYLTSSCVNWAYLCHKDPNLRTNELNTTFFLFDEPFKGSKSLKIFKISLTFRFDKLWRLSKFVHIGENSQILTVSNKKYYGVSNNNCYSWQ
jgi:hypothetical protein